MIVTYMSPTHWSTSSLSLQSRITCLFNGRVERDRREKYLVERKIKITITLSCWPPNQLARYLDKNKKYFEYLVKYIFCRIINILTREITICFKKITQMSKKIIIKMSSAYKIWEKVKKPCGLVICRIFLSFTSFERPLLRTSSTRQKSRGDKITLSNTSTTRKKNPLNCHLFW